MSGPIEWGSGLNGIITDYDRSLLADAYEEDVSDGPYPSYAKVAREGRGAFTLCSLRAIARARMEAATGITAPRVAPVVVPHEVLDVMASAMLDPALRFGKVETPALPTGNDVRKRVLQRALDAAARCGWTLILTT